MERDYGLLIENLKGRRYDEAIREPYLSEAYAQADLPECLLYTLESMVEVDASYAYKVYANSRRIHEKISKALKKHGYKVDYRYQGALKTHSSILLYGDVEIIVLLNEVTSKTHKAVSGLAHEILHIISGDPTFQSIDYSDKTRIRITLQKPTCEIDILPSVWVDSKEYLQTQNEIYRGIAEFDFKRKRVRKYLPFLNIARINRKDNRTNGNLKALSRLLKTLKADAHNRIFLTDSEINALVYYLPENMLKIDPGLILKLLPKLDQLLVKIASDSAVFSRILSPSGKECIFRGSPEKQQEIKKLQEELSVLLQDLKLALSEKDLNLNSAIPYLNIS